MARHKHAELLIALAEDDSTILQVQTPLGDWVSAAGRLHCPVLFPELNYRIEPAKPTKSSIDWPHVAPEFVAMATDKNGETFLYSEIPFPDEENMWWRFPLDGDVEKDNIYSPCEAFASFKPGTCDWKDSLVLRSDCE